MHSPPNPGGPSSICFAKIQYIRAEDFAGAARFVAGHANAKSIAGGINLIDLIKYNVEKPTAFVGIGRLDLRASPFFLALACALARWPRTAMLPSPRSFRHSILCFRVHFRSSECAAANKATTGGYALTPLILTRSWVVRGSSAQCSFRF